MNIIASKEFFYDWAGANVWIFKQINALSGKNGFYDQVMRAISDLSDGKHVFPYYLAGLAVIALLSLLFGAMKKRQGNRYIFAHWIAVIVLFALAFPVNSLINGELKDYFAYPRPYATMEVVQLEVRSSEDSKRSFPSGHVAFIVCLIACLWSKLSESQRPLGALAIVLVGWSRMAVGVHFPADVIASIIISLIVVALVRLVVFTGLTKVLHFKW